MAKAGAERRRLIGIDLAWKEIVKGKPNGTGCVELARDGDELTLIDATLRYEIGDIVRWIERIEPSHCDWVVAVDAPLIVRDDDDEGRREADAQASEHYRCYEAGAHSTNRKLLSEYAGGKAPRGEQLLLALKSRKTDLVEQAKDIHDGKLVFETYPHIAMVELFRLKRTIKYKKGNSADRLAGQHELTCSILEYLCSPWARPRLVMDDDDKLAELLCEPGPLPRGKIEKRLKDREDKLDALVCAYTAAWLDARRPLQGLGEVGKGVMITPRRRDIAAPLA